MVVFLTLEIVLISQDMKILISGDLFVYFILLGAAGQYRMVPSGGVGYMV